ncbi:MAG TPA: hypothetical protein VF528_09650 [Pyrinomonadaceae bacterium]|jgi:hypothetical protein
MNEQNEFFDDVIGDDLDTDATEWDAEPDDDDDDDGPVEMRTVVMTKNDMLALLGLKKSEQGGLIVRVDPREEKPAAQVYDDADAATRWFNKSVATSRKNGWSIVYDGTPLFG